MHDRVKELKERHDALSKDLRKLYIKGAMKAAKNLALSVIGLFAFTAFVAVLARFGTYIYSLL